MSAADVGLREESIRQYCRLLRLPTVGAQFSRMAEEALKERYSPVRYLEALLSAEIEEREHNAVTRRIFEAKMPRVKTLEDFDFGQTAHISAARLQQLAEGGYIRQAEPILFIGEPGTGKTHLATGLCVAACRQRRRARFTTATALVNELVEAKHGNQLSRALGRWSRYELMVIDELGYVPLAELGAELVFQVIADRAEKAAVIVTTNLPFSEWPQVFPNARLCRAMLDRLTDRAHIIETGTESFRFRRTAGSRHKKRNEGGEARREVSEGRPSASP
jgi:DNA replication protein DnaC